MISDDLLALGFIRAGNCSLEPTLKSGVRFSTFELRADRVIYAFTADTEVKYIGICDNTATCFSNRMGRYQSLTGGGTNERVAKFIKSALANGQVVEIYAWKPVSVQPIVVQGLHVDLVKGLENPLIARAKIPEWNIKS